MIKDVDFFMIKANIDRVDTDRERDMFSDVWALNLALGYDKANDYLKRWNAEGLNLVFVYPGLKEEPPEGAEYIGEANDGALYSISK